MKCILHIGTEKTGTTLLQDWLYLNQEQLGKQGVYLSDSLGRTNNRLFPAYFQGHLDDWAMANRIKTVGDKEEFFNGFLDQLSDQIKAASQNHDVFVISSEHLHSRVRKRGEIEAIRDFLDENFDESSVVCYFRSQADMAVSLYSTALRVSATGTVDEYLDGNVIPENYYYNFKSIADNWSSVFGKNNCSFKIYDRNRFTDGDIRVDFIETVSATVDLSALDFTLDKSNQSLNRLSAIAFRKINEHVPHWNKKTDSADHLNNVLKQEFKNVESLRRGKISSSKEAEIFRSFTASNREFFRNYFPNEAHFTPPNDDETAQEVFTIEDVEGILSDVFATFLTFTSAESKARLLDGDSGYLRDISVKIAQGRELSLEDAYALMLLAQRARPSGQFIENKVKEYADRLK